MENQAFLNEQPPYSGDQQVIYEQQPVQYSEDNVKLEFSEPTNVQTHIHENPVQSEEGVLEIPSEVGSGGGAGEYQFNQKSENVKALTLTYEICCNLGFAIIALSVCFGTFTGLCTGVGLLFYLFLPIGVVMVCFGGVIVLAFDLD